MKRVTFEIYIILKKKNKNQINNKKNVKRFISK